MAFNVYIVFACLIHGLSTGESNIKDFYVMMGSKTSYKFILMQRQQNSIPKLSGGIKYADDQELPKACKPVHLNIVLRHGTRFPKESAITRLSEFLTQFGEAIQNSDAFGSLNDWIPIFSKEEEKFLSGVGKKELKGLGKRYFTKYSSLFPDDDENENIVYKDIREVITYQSSDYQRTKESAASFMRGMKEALSLPREFNIHVNIDKGKLRFFDDCGKYQSSVENNATALIEYQKFIEGDEMREVAIRVAKRLGIDSNKFLEVDFSEILWSMFVMCGIEAADLGESLWCDLFTYEDAKVLEFRSDLKHFYRWGYYKVGYMQSCPLLKDILYHLDKAVIGSTVDHVYPRTVLQFGHAETLNPLYSLLGLLNDDKILKASNFKKLDDRMYRNSINTPMAANLAFVLYKCDTESIKKTQNPQKFERYMVEITHNERRIKPPFCDHDICPYSDMKKFYREIIDNCNMDVICEHKKVIPEKDEL